MSSRLRLLALLALIVFAALCAVVAQPEPEPAQANAACDVGSSIAGGVGLGNPVAGVCDAVTSKVGGVVTEPIKDALKGVGNGIFEQVTTWTAEGATWLIAALLGAAMLLLAILEAVAQSSWQILAKAVLINVPIAFIGTSAAFAVVQLLLLTTDQMSHAIAVGTNHHSEHFFKSAIMSLGEAGAEAGRGTSAASPATGSPGTEAAGAVAVPLFVTFLAAIIGAFAAFFVWIEMLMRDAAVYVVALFMPISMATFISPRWSGILRRTCELLVVVIGSKFVIVSIIALAAGLVSEDGAPVEHILAASALLLVACFAPFVLMRLVLSTEGAMSAAFSRRSASGGAQSGIQLARTATMVRSLARSNWGGKDGAEPPEVWSVKGGRGAGGGDGGGKASAIPGGGKAGGGPAGASGGGTAAGAGAAGAASGGVGVAAAAPAAATRSAKAAAQHLEDSAAARGAAGSGAGAGGRDPGGGTATRTARSGGAPASSTDPPSPPSPPDLAVEPTQRPPRDLDVKPTRGGDGS